MNRNKTHSQVEIVAEQTGRMDGGYRNTAQRAVILDEVRLAEGHLTAGEIFERVRRRDPHRVWHGLPRAAPGETWSGAG